MAEMLSPGVYIEERASALQVLQAVSTSTGGFVGFTPRGPTHDARLVTSYPEAERLFGGLTRQSFLGYSLAAFFQNGGSRAVVVRVVPSDAVSATGRVRSKTTDQRIETGATGTAIFTRSSSASVLRDNGGVTPLVPSSFTARWRAARAAITAQVCRTRTDSANLLAASGTALYEGRIDRKATRLVAGTGGNGGVYYRTVGDFRTDVQVAHINAGASQSLAVSVTGTRILVTLATDGSAVITSTAAQVAAAIAANATAAALVTATATGNGSGVAGAAEVANLQGLPTFDSALDSLVPGSLTITWQAGGSPVTISFSGLTTSPTQTQSNGAGSSATIDLRTGIFALVCASAETPAAPDVGTSITATYTPGSTAYSIVDDGSGALTGSALAAPGTLGYADGAYSFTTVAPAQASRAIGSGGNGTVTVTADLAGALGNGYTVRVVVPSGTAALSAVLVNQAITVNLAVTSGTPTSGANTATLIAAAIAALPGVTAVASGTGADEITTASAAASFTGGLDDTRPHNLAAVLATYKIFAWTIAPIAAGVWANDYRLAISGDPNFYTAATATYSRYRVAVQAYDASSLAWTTAESWEELVFTDDTHAEFWADVANELSDLFTVTEPGGNEAPGELAGVARSYVLAAGDESSVGQVLSVTLPDGPVAARSLTITYRDTTNTVRTITDNGFGVLTGSVDPAYATSVSGLGPNRVDMTTGQVNVKTLYGIYRGSLVTATYRSAPLETTHVERFGDTTAGYTAGADGTFTANTYGRNQISEPTGLQPLARGIYALDQMDELMQVVVPDFAGDTTVSADLLDYADGRARTNPAGADRFVLLTVPRGSTAERAVDWLQNQFGRSSKYAALYWPWVRIRDPLANNRLLTMPPLGHVAGVIARTDATRNVGKSPAGTVDGQLRYIAELELAPTSGMRDYVCPRKINPLREDSQVGRVVWGARTLSPTSEWRYISAVRLFMFVEKSIYNGTHWTVFENNGPDLWGRIKLQLEAFLGGLFEQGYFAGATRSEAYEIVVDRSNNPPETIEAGEVVIDVSLAPNKPAEFVRFRFQQRSLAA